MTATLFRQLKTDARNPANGDQGANGSNYINIYGVTFDTARFNSNNYAFEFDNLAVSGTGGIDEVPAPATLGLFGLGLAGLGLAARRRKTA